MKGMKFSLKKKKKKEDQLLFAKHLLLLLFAFMSKLESDFVYGKAPINGKIAFRQKGGGG